MEENKRITNELYFKRMMNITKTYMWLDTGNIYDLNDNKMKPKTLKGYVDLSQIVRKEFMDKYVELPEGDFNKMKIWKIINNIKKESKKCSK